jgi:hypothetical protein
MDSLDANLGNENTSFITTEVRSYLTEAAKWAKFLAIVGYIMIAFILLMGVWIMTMGGLSSPLIPGMAGFNMGAFGLIYVALGAFYFFPVYYLHQFSLKIKQGLTSQNPQDVTLGFKNLKSLFKFMGVFTIVILSIYVVMFLAIIGAAVVGLM